MLSNLWLLCSLRRGSTSCKLVQISIRLYSQTFSILQTFQLSKVRSFRRTICFSDDYLQTLSEIMAKPGYSLTRHVLFLLIEKDFSCLTNRRSLFFCGRHLCFGFCFRFRFSNQRCMTGWLGKYLTWSRRIYLSNDVRSSSWTAPQTSLPLKSVRIRQASPLARRWFRGKRNLIT